MSAYPIRRVAGVPAAGGEEGADEQAIRGVDRIVRRRRRRVVSLVSH